MQSNWQTKFFKDVANQLWWSAMTPEMTRGEVDFLERVLGTQPGANLLDVPCGNGRHAIEFASRGYAVTGVDQSQESIEEAQKSASPACRWRTGDMCDLPWESEFAGAYCAGNSFPYLDRDGAREFLSAIAKALKPRGRFAIDTGMAAESILPTLVRNRWHKVGDIFMLSENQYDPVESRLDIQYTFIQDGKVDTRPASSYCFTVAEIRRMHVEAGLEPIDQFGSFAGEPYQLASPRLILVSEKLRET
jgi:SAM-dependent methyltransferase